MSRQWEEMLHGGAGFVHTIFKIPDQAGRRPDIP
jgi:hypothetical protein